MPTTLKISVTKEILEKSKMCGIGELKGRSKSCAIALAVRDIFPDASVGGNYFDAFQGFGETVRLPQEAIQFILTFDSISPDERVRMIPIAFEVMIPDSIINQINIDELKPLLVNHPTLELINQ